MTPESSSTSPFHYRHRLVAAVASFGLLVTVLMALLVRPGPDFSTRPFLRETTVHRGWTFVRLAVTNRPDGTVEQTTTVRLEPGAGLDRASAIAFQFDLYREGTNSGHVILEADLVSGEVSTPDGAVRFELPPNSRLREKELVHLARKTPFGEGSEANSLVLRFVTRGDRRLTLESNTIGYFPDSIASNQWSWVRGPGQTKVFAPPGSTIYAALPIGQFVFPLVGQNDSRAGLLAFLWDLPSGAALMGLAIGWALLFGLGVLCALEGAGGPAWRPALGIALMFAAVSLGYAVLSPPLDAPDEQDHFLSFLEAVRVPEARSKVMNLAARNHWERWVPLNSRFEKISADDCRAQYLVSTRDWATSGLVAQERSGLGGHYWRGISGWVVDESVPRMLLKLRITNAIACAACAFLGAMMFLRRAGPGGGAVWAPLGLVLLSSMAYLAMASSNYVLVVGSGIILAGAVSLGRPDRKVEEASWFFAALAAGIAVQSSRSGLTLVGFAPLLAGRWLMATARNDGVRWGESLRVWSLLAIGLLAPWAVSAADYRADVLASIERLAGARASGLIRQFPFVAWVVLVAVAGCASERLAARISRGKLATLFNRGLDQATQVGWLVPPAMVAVVVWFQFVRLPPTASNGQELSALGHVLFGFGKFLGSLGPGQHDYLLSQTYWNILGWGDVQLPEWAVDLFASLALVGWTLTWIEVARRRDASALIQVGLLSVACFGYLAAMLLATRAAGYTLVGRYMIVFFTVFLTFAWAGWRPWLSRLTGRGPVLALGLWVALPVGLHLFCWRQILNHFF